MSGSGAARGRIGADGQSHRRRPASANERILVVEDDRETRELIELALRSAGYIVTTCVDAITAQLEIERALPDAVIADHNLPGATGMSLVRWLRDNPRTADLPAVMYTATGDAETAAEAKRAGCADFLVKPASARQLVRSLRAAIVRRHVKAT